MCPPTSAESQHPQPSSPSGDTPARAPSGRAGRGLFVVLEGIDGAGTTTQGRLLLEHLTSAGHRALLTHEPSDGPVGMLIRLALTKRLLGRSPDLHAEGADEHAGPAALNARALALLFAADRMDHLASQVEPNLAQGRHVLCDRYLLSSLAYQGLTLPEEWVREINRHAIVPDLTFYLDLSAEKSRARMQASRWTRDLYEDDWHLRRIRERYVDVVARNLPEVGEVITIDASLPVAEVTRRIAAVLDERIAALRIAADPQQELPLADASEARHA